MTGVPMFPPASWFDTDRPYDRDAVIPDLLAAAAERFPERPALVDDDGVAYTHRELAAATGDTADQLRGIGIGRGDFVGVLAGHHAETVRAILAVQRCGAAYVPIDPRWPAHRIGAALRQVGAICLLADRGQARPAFEVSDLVPTLRHVVLIDGDADEALGAGWDADAIVDLWDFVAESDDPLTAAGFNLQRSGAVEISQDQAYAYRDRVVRLARSVTGPDSRVLDIGCGSGLVLRELAGSVASCVGIDPSGAAVASNTRWAAGRGPADVHFEQGFAHEVADLVEGTFDLILLSSVVQFFPGPGYLDRVLSACTRLLAPGGRVLIADVVDPSSAHGAGLLRLPTRFFPGVADGWYGSVRVYRPDPTGLPDVLADRYDVLLGRVADADEPARPPVRLVSLADLPRSRGGGTPAVAATDVAYCIFTSGSTGVPKGVLGTHRAVVNLIDWVNREFAVDETDRLLFVTSYGFDLSVYDMFGVLAAGASIRLVEDDDLADPDLLLDLLVEEPITFWDSAPAAMAYLLTATAGRDLPERPPALRRVFLSGDWIPLAMPAAVRQSFPRAEVIALGGATEATVWSNSFRVGEVDPQWPSIPYGRPMQNARYHILDEDLRACPVGVPGDLYIAGDCVCAGYAGDPELTAQRFRPEVNGRPGERMYRTGDRAQWLPDGEIRFLGRLDDQVKVQGYRIELGDVQSALSRHPDVAESAAVVVSGTGDHLVGFFTARRGVTGPIDPAGLHDFVAGILPSYMVPHRLVQVPSLPITGSGKVDRARLADMARTDPGAAAASPVVPAAVTPTEGLLIRLVGELLGRSNVGLDDDFFALGGHSLLAAQLLGRAGAELGRQPSIRAVYEHPTIGALAACLDSTAADDPVAAVPARDPGQPAPLSVPQQRVWFLEQLTPGNLAYNAQVTVRLTGPLDVDLLRRVLLRIGERHEILRTGFRAESGDCLAEVAATAEVDLVVRDAAPDRIAEQVDDFVRRPFDLARPPLARWLVLRHGPADHTIVLSEHHFVHDGWSLAVLFEEIETLYTAYADGRPDPLPALPVQYGDFAAWQRAEAPAADPSGWLARLSGAPTVLDLPTDRPRPVRQSHSGDCLTFTLPVELVRDLRAFSRREQVTLFAVMFTAFAVLVSRYADQDDLLIGTAAARRDRPELRRLIGMLVDTVPVRFTLDAEPEFRALVHRTHRELGEIFSLPEVPIERLVDELVPERDPAFTPLVQAMFSFHDSPVPDLDFAGLSGDLRVRHNGSAKNDLNVIVIPRGEQRAARAPSERDDEVLVLWEFCDALFDAGTMRSMSAHYLDLLHAAMRSPEAPVGELTATPSERQREVLDELAGTVAEVEPPWVTELVLDQARRRPDHPAVVTAAGTLTYAGLDAASASVARRLHDLAGPVRRVAVFADRSAELVVAQLAVLRSGAAFVPIDPGYPAERIAHLLADSGAQAVLAGAGSAERLPVLEVPVLEIDALGATGPADFGPIPVSGLDAAYVVYTSGSTGQPKGIEVTHANLANLARQAALVQELSWTDRGALLFSTGFDGSLWEVWPALVSGMTLHVPTEEIRGDAAALVTWLAETGLTVVCMPTPLAEAVLTEPWPPGAALRILGAGGDALRRTPRPDHPFTLLNVYGPTETTIACVVGPVEPGAKPRIGRPLGNVRAYVLDERMRPVPPGVPGELVIGGAAVSRGYLGRPARTAEVFLPDPFDDRPGARMYRTGDRARWCADGTLECLGRADDQVKVNGYRVEPGEVVAALRRDPEVADAHVVARETTAGGRRLIGYVVPRPGVRLSTDRLTDRLRGHLPGYMVPGRLVAIGELPLTAHGKVDRDRLPDPDPDTARTRRPFSATETRLAPIWADVLGGPAEHPDADFFAAGGQSLLAVKLLADVATTTGYAVPLAAFLEAPTLAGLARAVEAAPAAGPAETSTAAGIDAATARQTLDRLDEMSEEEIEAMLRDLDPTP